MISRIRRAWAAWSETPQQRRTREDQMRDLNNPPIKGDVVIHVDDWSVLAGIMQGIVAQSPRHHVVVYSTHGYLRIPKALPPAMTHRTTFILGVPIKHMSGRTGQIDEMELIDGTRIQGATWIDASDDGTMFMLSDDYSSIAIGKWKYDPTRWARAW